MSAAALLPDLERQGFRFALRGDRLTVQAAPGLLDDRTVQRLRQQKPQLLKELRRRENFIQLVRVTAACEHRILLARWEISAELDKADLEALASTSREDRQAWAKLLAHRLTRQRIAS